MANHVGQVQHPETQLALFPDNIFPAVRAYAPGLKRLPFNTVSEVTMYITDATHFLDDTGAIGPQSGPGRTMADFFGTAIVAATLQGAVLKQPVCFKCSGSAKTPAPVGKVIEWLCSGCGESGRITHWEGTLWDMTDARNDHAVSH